MSAPRGALVVMSKVPRPGHVKTRLAAGIGDERTLELYRAFLGDVLERAVRVAVQVGVRVLFAHAEPTWPVDVDRAWVPPSVELGPQRGPDLGARMAAAVEDAGPERVVLIGGDSPAMEDRRLFEAFAGVDQGEVVFGPVEDGGYNLIGLPRPVPELFVDIPWSTDVVFERSLARARSLGLSVRVLDRSYDVDRPEDLARLAADPALVGAPRTAARLTGLGLRGDRP